jgi:putative hemolysin
LEDSDIESSYSYLFLFAENILQPIDISVIIGLITLLILIVLSALVSGSEIAFFSINYKHLKALHAEKDNKPGQQIITLLERPKRLLATILIANNFVNIAIVILSSYIIEKAFNLDPYPIISFFIQIIVVTSILLVMGEIMPKIYASFNPMRLALFMAGPLKKLVRLFYPLSAVLVRSTNFFDRKIQKSTSQLSMSELSEAIELTSNEDTPEEERKILKGIVKFGDIDVKEIMKARIDVTAVDKKTNYHQLLEIILDAGYSRIPVYNENFDKVAGLLYVKDLLPYINETDDFDWAKLLRNAFFVPENKKINDLLKEFQEKKIHLAIVVDEYGGTSGIVTLEDILEEIVGEISDEFDTIEDELNYTQLEDGSYLFDGKTLLNDFCKIMNIEMKLFEHVKGDSETMAGLILEIEGRIPAENSSTIFDKFEFITKKVTNRRIQEVLVKVAQE